MRLYANCMVSHCLIHNFAPKSPFACHFPSTMVPSSELPTSDSCSYRRSCSEGFSSVEEAIEPIATRQILSDARHHGEHRRGQSNDRSCVLPGNELLLTPSMNYSLQLPPAHRSSRVGITGHYWLVMNTKLLLSIMGKSFRVKHKCCSHVVSMRLFNKVFSIVSRCDTTSLPLQ